MLTKAARTCCTSGVAVLGAAAIAVSPVQPPPALSAPHAMESLAVDLAAVIDPITPWVDTFKSAAANISTLLEFYAQKPLPMLQTFGANAKTYLGEIQSGNAKLILGQIANNIATLFQAPFSPGETAAFPVPPGSQTPLAIGEYISGTSTGVTTPTLSYRLLFFQIVNQTASPACQDQGDCLVVNASPVLNLINNHFSAVFIGLFGTVLAPIIQLTKSFTAIGDFVKAGDAGAAINELINIPANLTNAVLNGTGYLDRTAAVGTLIPGGLPVDSIGVELGGLLSSTPYDGSVTNPDNPPTRWTGGVAFDGVTTTVGSNTLKGLKLGFLGSTIGMGQFLSDQLLVTPPQAGPAVGPAADALPTAAKTRVQSRLRTLGPAARVGADGTGNAVRAAATASGKSGRSASAAAKGAPPRERLVQRVQRSF